MLTTFRRLISSIYCAYGTLETDLSKNQEMLLIRLKNEFGQRKNICSRSALACWGQLTKVAVFGDICFVVKELVHLLGHSNSYISATAQMEVRVPIY